MQTRNDLQRDGLGLDPWFNTGLFNSRQKG